MISEQFNEIMLIRVERKEIKKMEFDKNKSRIFCRHFD